MKYQEIVKPVKAQLRRIDEYMQSIVNHEVQLLPQVSSYILQSGGKRIRPLLTCLCGKLVRAPEDFILKAGAIVELLHTATLIHDDVVDVAEMRRGKPSANVVWGNKVSVLAGDYILAYASQVALELDNQEVMRILLDVVIKMVEGEAIQLYNTDIDKFNSETYMEIITRKTAYLMACACELPAIGINSSPEARRALRKFGLDFGIAFQLADDALDYDSIEERTGKTPGKDLREHKITLPLVLAYERASNLERKHIKDFLSKQQFAANEDEDQIQTILSLVLNYGGARDTRRLAQEYARRANAHLREVFKSNGEYILRLNELCHYVAERKE